MLSDQLFISSDVMLLYEVLLESGIYTGQDQKIPKDFQALVALVAKKLSQTVLLQLCWISLFVCCLFVFYSLFARFLEGL